jgi:(E)-4-hydroxy-3-methyl-but-2-enyl pyrophosphate reductase
MANEEGLHRMRVTVAKALGTCFGVRDAIELALENSANNELTVIGQLVHNPQTVDRLREKGVQVVDKFDPSQIKTKAVMITAHGAPESLRKKAETVGYRVIDASCPLVLRVHKAVAELVSAGYHPVVIGQAEHVEVKGIVGDLKDYTVIRRSGSSARRHSRSTSSGTSWSRSAAVIRMRTSSFVTPSASRRRTGRWPCGTWPGKWT